MRVGLIGPSYTLQSTAFADEECLNWFAQSVESQASIVPTNAYGGKNAAGIKNYVPTPGLTVFANLPTGQIRALLEANGRMFCVSGTGFFEITLTGGNVPYQTVGSDSQPASMAFNGLQVLVVSAGRAWCFTLATNAIIEVTGMLQGVPVKVEYDDTYFVVMFQNSNKYQMSQVLDGTTWPGQLVNEVSVFAGNITSIICNHRELWVFSQKRSQPYQDTGSAEIFDVIPGALIEKGNAALFSPCLIDNSVFWVDEDERGARMCWRSNGYTPTRVSTYAVELDLQSYSGIGNMVTYSYQQGGHLFWVLYIPGAQWSWVFDVTENMWHKRASWNAARSEWGPHWSWVSVYAFGKNLVGDPFSGNIYQLDPANLTDNGTLIRRLRRSPTLTDEMKRMYMAELTLDFETGVGPEPPLLDDAGDPRPPFVMLRWSDDRGKTWSNIHQLSLGMAGEYKTRVIQRRMGQFRYRVLEVSMTDPVRAMLVDAYAQVSPSTAP